jgi:hypothetical protein
MDGPAWMAAVLDCSGPLFCIRNGAVRGLKIMKIVASGYQLRSQELHVKRRERALFRNYQQLRDHGLTENARPSIRFFNKTPKLLFRRIKPQVPAFCSAFYKEDHPGLFSGSPVSHSPAPARRHTNSTHGPVPALPYPDDDPLRQSSFQPQPVQHTNHAQRRQRGVQLRLVPL